MTKHRRTRRRRSQKGGGVLDYFGFGSSEPTESYAAPTQSWGEYFSSWGTSWGTKAKEAGNSFDTAIGNVATSGANAISDATSSFMGTGSDTTNVDPNSSTVTGTAGGRRRKRSIKGGSNLAYYAAPVSGLKVAEPTSWQYYVNGPNQYSVKGGSRRRKGRKVRRTRRHRKH
jgi:hypothetical protein